MNTKAIWSIPMVLVAAHVLGSTVAHADDFPLASELCSAELNFRDGDAVYHVPYCRNRALSSVNPGVTRAVIVIPGSASPARTHYATVKRLAEEEDLDDTTTILVPNFLEDDGSGDTVLETLNLPDNYLYWTSSWRYGNRAVNGTRISSFEVIDMIIRNLLANNPNLEHIAVVGHSAGGRVVNRYAGGTAILTEATAAGVSISFGVFAPGQVMYLNDNRPYSTASCDDSPSTEGDFRRYPDGLVGIEDHSYMRDSTAATIRGRLFARHIYYTVGVEDDELFTGACDRVQGTNRLDLQRKYGQHLWSACLAHHGGGTSAIGRCQGSYFRRAEIFGELPGVDHSHRGEYETQRGRDILFYWD
jgi:hypothetical protein